MNEEGEGNPLLAPIHGVSLKDYAALVMNLGNFDEAACLPPSVSTPHSGRRPAKHGRSG